MGQIIEFPSNGGTGNGYIAAPGKGAEGTAGIVVLQEWWGLVDQIKRTCDRFAEAGFTALAPDLYHGTTVPLTEPNATTIVSAASVRQRESPRKPA